MEIFILVLFYYLTQNPHFAESVKPLMSQIKDSEQMLCFLNDLSKFSKAFGGLQNEKDEPKKEDCSSPPKKEPEKDEPSEDKKNPQSPTAGIADEFIQTILDSYLNQKKD